MLSRRSTVTRPSTASASLDARASTSATTCRFAMDRCKSSTWRNTRATVSPSSVSRDPKLRRVRLALRGSEQLRRRKFDDLRARERQERNRALLVFRVAWRRPPVEQSRLDPRGGDLRIQRTARKVAPRALQQLVRVVQASFVSSDEQRLAAGLRIGSDGAHSDVDGCRHAEAIERRIRGALDRPRNPPAHRVDNGRQRCRHLQR